ncbi:hypothetical protein Hanom_Chr02g00116511 [Helianthus anomalus]
MAQKKTLEKTKGLELKDSKEPAPKKTKFIIKPLRSAELEVEKEKEKETTDAAIASQHDVVRGPEVTRIIGLDQPFKEKDKTTAQHKGPEVVKPTEPTQPDAPTQPVQSCYCT